MSMSYFISPADFFHYFIFRLIFFLSSFAIADLAITFLRFISA